MEEVSVRIFSMFSVYCFSVISAVFMISLILFQMQSRRAQWSVQMIATAAESAQVRSSWAGVAADVAKVYGRSAAVTINETSVRDCMFVYVSFCVYSQYACYSGCVLVSLCMVVFLALARPFVICVLFSIRRSEGHCAVTAGLSAAAAAAAAAAA